MLLLPLHLPLSPTRNGLHWVCTLVLLGTLSKFSPKSQLCLRHQTHTVNTWLQAAGYETMLW